MLTIRRSVYLAAATLVAVSTVTVLSTPGQAATSTPRGCASTLFDHPVRAAHAAANSPRRFETAAAHNNKTVREFKTMAMDKGLWLDECGQAFYMEPISTTQGSGDATVPAIAPGAQVSATALQPVSETFKLESKPGSTRTLYLDFTGDTLTGTLWNATYGDSLVVDPYSMYDPVDTNFTDAELVEIQKVWQVVAEDYAPFDVNVTTKDPGPDALDRTDPSDMVYGSRVIITGSGPVFNACACGGFAPINVFNYTGATHMYYQPAFVFTAGVGASGKTIGEAASHEAGHLFGLTHDGSSIDGTYYYGYNPWAPIMGAAYYQPVSQWSAGEYPGSTNREDDVSVIATGAPLVTDDHGDTAESGSGLVFDTPSVGVIGTRTDVDAFSFTGSGPTRITLSPAAGAPNLHASIRIEDSAGAVIGTADAGTPDLVATWVSTLPDTPAPYTVFVDGTGTGDPSVPGNYSDYGSLGNYQILQSRPVTQARQKSVTFSDTVGDVTRFGIGNNLALDPSQEIGDATRTVLANGDTNVTVKMTFADLKKVPGSSLRVSLKVRTNEGVKRLITLTAKDAAWSGRTKITTPTGTPVKCEVSTTIRYDTNKVTVRVPRSCLSGPKWVQVKASVQTVAPDETRYLDDALSGDPVTDSAAQRAWSEKAYV